MSCIAEELLLGDFDFVHSVSHAFVSSFIPAFVLSIDLSFSVWLRLPDPVRLSQSLQSLLWVVWLRSHRDHCERAADQPADRRTLHSASSATASSASSAADGDGIGASTMLHSVHLSSLSCDRLFEYHPLPRFAFFSSRATTSIRWQQLQQQPACLRRS